MVVRLSLGENRHEGRSTVNRSQPRRLCCRLCAHADGSGSAAAASAAADCSPGASPGGRALCRAGAAVAVGQEISQMVPLRAGPASPGMAFAGAHDAVFDGSGSGPDGAASGSRRRSGASHAAGRRRSCAGCPAQRSAARAASERSLIPA